MKGIIALIAVVLLSGCASTQMQVIDKPEKSKRLFYRDLSIQQIPDPEFAAQNNMERPVIKKKGLNVIGMEAPFFISFSNESSELKAVAKNSGLSLLLKNVDTQARYIIVGYSHGFSAAGIEKLATERAKNIALVLRNQGVPESNLHLFASYSDMNSAQKRLKTFPSIGAHVFKVYN